MILHKAYLDIPLRKLNLVPGCTGNAVFSLQMRLQNLGLLTTAPTGIYDQTTQDAISAFQQANGLGPDGIITPKTYLLLNRDSGVEITPAKHITTLAAAGASIQITRSSRILSLYHGGKLHGQYPIAVGKPGTPTPLGNYAIATKVQNPGGILGTRWMGLNFDTYGIHGTNRPWLIGQAVSLGCIRMHNENIEKVFSIVRIGTPVSIRD